MFEAARRAVVSHRSAELFAKEWFDITLVEEILRADGRKMTAAQYAHLRPLHCAKWAQMGAGVEEVREYLMQLIGADEALCADCEEPVIRYVCRCPTRR